MYKLNNPTNIDLMWESDDIIIIQNKHYKVIDSQPTLISGTYYVPSSTTISVNQIPYGHKTILTIIPINRPHKPKSKAQYLIKSYTETNKTNKIKPSKLLLSLISKL